MIFDVAPILTNPESHAILRRVDATCLVVQASKTRKDRAAKALSELAQSGASVLGSILNRYQAEIPSWFGGNRAA